MQFLIPFFAVAAALWGVLFVLRGSLLAGCLLLLSVTGGFGYLFFHLDIGSGTITLDRLALLLLLGMYVVHRWMHWHDPKPLGFLEGLVLAFIGLLSASIMLSGKPPEFDELKSPEVPIWRMTVGYSIPAMLFWIGRQSRLNESAVRGMWFYLAGVGIYLSITGLLEITHQWWAVFPKTIADPTIGLHFGRARGPMLHSVSFGMAICITLMAAWSLWAQVGSKGRAAIALLTPLYFAGMLFSLTRSVWIGAALGLGLILFLALQGRWRWAFGLCAAGACALGVVFGADSFMELERETTAAESAVSAEYRVCFAYVSGKMFEDHPMFGVGFGHFPTAKVPYLADRSTNMQLEGIRHLVHHNTFLSLLTEVGLVGLSLFVLVLIGTAQSSWQLWRDTSLPSWARWQGLMMLGVLPLYVTQLALHEMSYSTLDNAFFFFLAGVTRGVQLAGTAGQTSTASFKAAEDPPPRLAMVQPR